MPVCDMKEYIARRVAEGHTKMEAIRCLKSGYVLVVLSFLMVLTSNRIRNKIDFIYIIDVTISKRTICGNKTIVIAE